jgi:hypothetical protein
MIIFNWTGLLTVLFALVVGTIVGFLVSLVSGNDEVVIPMQLTVACFIMVVVDLSYRKWTHPTEGKGRFLLPHTGGHIWFIPVWMIGIIPVAVSTLALCVMALKAIGINHGGTVLAVFGLLVFGWLLFRRFRSKDIHVDLEVTRRQIDGAETVPIRIPRVRTIEVKLDPTMDEGMQLRFPQYLKNGAYVYAHIKVRRC